MRIDCEKEAMRTWTGTDANEIPNKTSMSPPSVKGTK